MRNGLQHWRRKLVIDYSEPYKDEIHNLLVKYGLNWTHSPGGMEFYKTGVDDTCNIAGYFTKKEYDKLVNWIERNNISEEIRMMLNSPLGGRRGIGFGLGRSWQRAAGGFTPTDIAGLRLWLDFSDASTLFVDAGITPVSADGQAIYQANDKSGNGKNFAQSYSFSRPLYKIGVQNSLSASLYDGTDDSLLRDDTLGFTGSPLFTLFAVGKSLASGRYFSLGNSKVGRQIGLQSDGSYRYNNGNEVFSTVSASTVLDTFLRESTTYAGQAFRRNASSLSATSSVNGAATPSLDTALSLVGAYQYRNQAGTFNGHIMEIVMYDSVLSVSDYQSVESYLNNKWAIY